MKRFRGRRILAGTVLLPLLVVGAFAWATWRQVARERNRRPLFNAITARDLSGIRAALDAGADPNARDRPDLSLNLIEIIKKMLHRSAPDPDDQYKTALSLASERGDPDVVKLLLDRGANPRLRVPGGNTALHVAVGGRVANVILDHGGEIEATNLEGRTPLISAVCDKRSMTAEAFLERGARADREDNNAKTSIEYAAENEEFILYRPLLEHKANPNSRDSEGVTLLCRAIARERNDLVEALLNHHADPNYHPETTSDYITNIPLVLAFNSRYYADRYGSSGWNSAERLKLITRLLDYNADPNTRDRVGKPVFWSAVEAEWLEEARAFLAHGANPNTRFENRTVLMEAVGLRNPALVKLLLSYHADPRIKDDFGRSAIRLASYQNDPDIAQLLSGHRLR